MRPPVINRLSVFGKRNLDTPGIQFNIASNRADRTAALPADCSVWSVQTNTGGGVSTTLSTTLGTTLSTTHPVNVITQENVERNSSNLSKPFYLDTDETLLAKVTKVVTVTHFCH